MIHKFTLLENLLLRFNIIPHPVVDALNHVIAGRGLQVSVNIGIFDALEKNPKNVMEIAKSTNSNPEGISALLPCLKALGYVGEINSGKFILTKKGKRFLSKDSEFSLNNTILFSDYVFGSLNDLEENVKRGGPKNVNLDVFTPRQWEIFNNTMIEVAKTNAKEIANLIPLSKGYKRLLDIGGSHGLHAIEICKKVPGLSAEVLDLKPVEQFAKKTIKNYKMIDRVKFRVGDLLKDDFGKNYDVILAFNMIHGFSPEMNYKLTEKVYRALNSDGIYVILDQIKDAGGNSELSKLVSSTMGLMLFNVAGGRTYSFEEVSAWISKGGFKNIELKKLRSPGNALIIGYK